VTLHPVMTDRIASIAPYSGSMNIPLVEWSDGGGLVYADEPGFYRAYNGTDYPDTANDLVLPSAISQHTVICALNPDSTSGGGSTGFEAAWDAQGLAGGGSLGIGGVIQTQTLTGEGSTDGRQDPGVPARTGPQVWAASFPLQGPEAGFFRCNFERQAATRGASQPSAHRRFGNKGVTMRGLCEFYEVLYFSRALSAAQCNLLVAWLGQKHGIDVNAAAPVQLPAFGPFIDAASRTRYWLRGTPDAFEVGFSLDDDASDPEIWVPYSDRPEGLSKAAWRRIGANAAEVLS
jgi:hypothetical protein